MAVFDPTNEPQFACQTGRAIVAGTTFAPDSKMLAGIFPSPHIISVITLWYRRFSLCRVNKSVSNPTPIGVYVPVPSTIGELFWISNQEYMMNVRIAGMIAGLMLIFAGSALAADKDIYNYEAQAAAPAGTKRIVFIATHGTHGGIGNHEFLAGSIYLARRINEVYPNAYAVVYTEDKWPKDLSNATSIIVSLNHGGKAAQDVQVKAACDHGAGFMAIHFGTEVNKARRGKIISTGWADISRHSGRSIRPGSRR